MELLEAYEMHAHVKNALNRVWVNRIWHDFLEHRILSERELQSRLFAHLSPELEDVGLRIFVEPTIRGLPERRRCPDMVIAARHEASPLAFKAIAVVELKIDRSGHGIEFREELTRIENLGPLSTATIDCQRPDLSGSSISLEMGEQVMFFLGLVGRGDDPTSNGSTAAYPERIRKYDEGFAANHNLAARTFLLCGRIHRDGASLFHSEPFSPLIIGATPTSPRFQ